MEKQAKKKKSLFRRILKWTGITFLILIVAIIVLPFIFKDKLIQMAKDEANKQLNAKVDFGQFDLTLFSSFPDFRFKIDNVSVVGIDEFKGDTLIGIKHLETDVDLMSVIKGDQYKVKEISIQQPRIFAKVLHDGKANWDITKPSTDTTAAPSDTSATKFKLSLKKLEIKDAVIVYDDAKSDMKAVLDDFDFDLSGDFTQDNFLMEITSEIQKMNFSMGGVSYAKNLHNKMKINMDMDMPNMKFTFKENEFAFNELVLGIDGFVAMPGNDINMDVKFICKQTEFKSILSLIPAVYSKDFASVTTSGKLALNGYAKGTYNDKVMPAFGAHLEIANAMFKYPSLPKSVNNINVKVDVENPNGNPDATLIDVHKFHVEMAGNPVDMVMHVATPVSDPSLNGEITGKIVLASVKEFVPMEKGDDLNGTITLDVKMNGRMSMIEKQKYDEFKASGSVIVDKMNYKTASLPFEVVLNTMKLNFTPQYVELAGFDAKMGRSDVNANGKIENFMQYLFKDSLIKGVFTMNSSLIDINELMGPPAPQGATTATPAAPADSTPMAVIGVPRNIDFVLNSSIAKLIYDKIDITNVAGNIVIRNARVDMTNLKMNLLDGNMVISGAYDTKNLKKPGIDFDLNINDFDIGKTYDAFGSFAKMAPAGKYAKGKFTATVNDMKGTLNEKMEPDMNTLTGHGVFKTSSVSVEGFEPFVKLGDALKMDKLKKMEFSNITAPYEFKDGRVHLRDTVRTKIQDINTKIIGSTGFDQTIDYKWKMEIPTKALPSQAAGALNSLISEANKKGGKFNSLGEKVDVTALFTGTVTKPEIKTGLKDMAKDVVADVKEQVKEKIEEKKEEVINDVKQKASAEAEKILADAQKQADNVKAEAAKVAEQVKAEGYKQADDLEANASNPIAKIAAKKAAEKLRKESDAKAQKINDEAAVKSDKIMEEARAKADKLKQ
ncbi:MAG: AsmA-like C-terminal region-containing protein [Bacteroidia bacterium]